MLLSYVIPLSCDVAFRNRRVAVFEMPFGGSILSLLSIRYRRSVRDPPIMLQVHNN